MLGQRRHGENVFGQGYFLLLRNCVGRTSPDDRDPHRG